MNSNYVHVGIVGNTKKICVSKQYNSKFYMHLYCSSCHQKFSSKDTNILKHAKLRRSPLQYIRTNNKCGTSQKKLSRQE